MEKDRQYLMSVLNTRRELGKRELSPGLTGPPGPPGPPGEGRLPMVGDILLTAAAYPEPIDWWLLCETGEILPAYRELHDLLGTFPDPLPTVDSRIHYYIYGGPPDYPPYQFSIQDGNLYLTYQGGTQGFHIEGGNLLYDYEGDPPDFEILNGDLYVNV